MNLPAVVIVLIMLLVLATAIICGLVTYALIISAGARVTDAVLRAASATGSVLVIGFAAIAALAVLT